MLIFTRTISLVISCLFVFAIFYNVISNYFLSNPNKTLFASDPFNFENRVAYLNSAVRRTEIDPDELETLQKIADAGIILEPLDARILALAGAIKERSDKDAAQQYYLRALELKRTDRIAITQRYVYLIEHQQFKEAIPLLELISARWPDVFTQLRPTIPALLQTQENIDEVLSRFKTRVPYLGQIVRSILENTESIELASKLVLDAHSKYNIDVHKISQPITTKLLNQGRASEAYLLFYKTLFKEERENSGYVFNSKFSAEPTSYYFDWNISSQAGVNLQRIKPRVLSTDGVGQSKLGGLKIKFLNAPVAFSNVSQLLYLPKQAYQLSVKYSVDDFSGPSPISVKLLCARTEATLTQIELPQTNTSEAVKTAAFVVPQSGCELQKILISNNNIVESWKNRFDGTVTLHEISIQVPNS